MLQLLTSTVDTLSQSFYVLCLNEVATHQVFGALPEIARYLPINAFVTHDRKLMIGVSQVKQDAVALFGFMHPQVMKHVDGALNRVC